MPRQRVNYTRRTYNVPDFPERLVRFKEESGLSWAEIVRRLGAQPYTVRRWVLGRARPGMAYMLVRPALAEELGLRHIFTDWEVRRRTGLTPAWCSPGPSSATLDA